MRKSDDVVDAEWRPLGDQPLSKRPPQPVVPARQKSSRRYYAWVYVITNLVFSFLFCATVDLRLWPLPILVLVIWTLVVTGATKKYLNSK